MHRTFIAAAMPQVVAAPVLLALAIVLTGRAASLKGYPDPSTDPDGDLKQLATYTSPDAIAKYEAVLDPILGALTDVTVACGAALQDAQQKIAFRFGKPDSTDLFARKKNAADFVGSLARAGKLSDIGRLATVFGIASGPPALPGILIEIDRARDKPTMDAVSHENSVCVSGQGVLAMVATAIALDGNNSLADFELWARQQEQILGPLLALAKQGTDNVGTFDAGAKVPDDAHLVELRACVGGAAVPRAGFQVVCTGNCLVIGQPTMVAAYRRIA
jgi:hypothetical protein